MNFLPNPNKRLDIEVHGKIWQRLPIKTHLITDKDDILNVVNKYVKPYIKKGDFLFISERIVATSQGRAIPIKDIKPSWLAKFLVKFVYKSPYGIGIGSSWTMELAIREAGVFLILMGVIAAILTKPFGIRGVFYRVVGHGISSIDGPADYVLPPYNKYAKLGPKEPDKVAKQISENLGGIDVVIVDANDLGVAVLGRSDKKIDKVWSEKIFKDNPLGQTIEQTPMAIVRIKNQNYES